MRTQKLNSSAEKLIAAPFKIHNSRSIMMLLHKAGGSCDRNSAMKVPALMFELENPVEERPARLEANVEEVTGT
jgi:hypothetical protein